jgi:hypothetical protein
MATEYVTSNRSLSPQPIVGLDVSETTFTELDDGSYFNLEYAHVGPGGVLNDQQWSFTEAQEFTANSGGIDLMDALTFESLGEDGVERVARIIVEVTGIDPGAGLGAVPPVEDVDYVQVHVVKNGNIIASSTLAEGVAASNHTVNVTTTVKDGDVLQFPGQLESSSSSEVDVVSEAEETAIFIEME